MTKNEVKPGCTYRLRNQLARGPFIITMRTSDEENARYLVLALDSGDQFFLNLNSLLETSRESVEAEYL